MKQAGLPSPRPANFLVRFFWPIIAVLLPAKLLWPLDRNFYVDWFNHQWAIGYFGEYFRRHWLMPAIFNTKQWGGMATPIFYGNLFYPLLGLFASILAPGMVIRIAVVLLFAAQYRWVAQALDRLQAPRWVAYSVPCLVIWAIYPQTNLYNRSALTEFFATTLLVCALSLAILLVHASSKPLERRYARWTMLCLALSAGAHPITALMGIPFFAIFAVMLWNTLREEPERRRSILRSLAPGLVASFACMAAWLYATIKYKNHLKIRQAVPSVVFMPRSLDNWLVRFYPIPFDHRAQPGVSLNDISTPFLDAQINIPLLIIFVALAGVALYSGWGSGGRARLSKAVAIPSVLFAFFTWISLSPTSYDYLPATVRMIQTAYRAVTYQNLALLLGVFVVLLAVQNSPAERPPRNGSHPALHLVAAACLLLSLYGVRVKWAHGIVVRTVVETEDAGVLPTERQRRGFIELPVWFYGANDYTAADGFVPLPAEQSKTLPVATFGFDSGDQFGVAQPLQVTLNQTSWVKTNVQAFPWNQFEIDSRELPHSDLRVFDNTALAVRVPAGSHGLTVKFVPDRVWLILRAVSLITFFGWLLLEVVLFVIGPWIRPRQTS